MENSFWWSGPEFLRNPESDWPKAPQEQTDDKQAMAELVKCPPNVTHSLVNSQESSTQVDFSAVVDPKNYNSLTK